MTANIRTYTIFTRNTKIFEKSSEHVYGPKQYLYDSNIFWIKIATMETSEITK